MTRAEILGWIRTHENTLKMLRSLPFQTPSTKGQIRVLVGKIAALRAQLKQGTMPMLLVVLAVGLVVFLRGMR